MRLIFWTLAKLALARTRAASRSWLLSNPHNIHFQAAGATLPFWRFSVCDARLHRVPALEVGVSCVTKSRGFVFFVKLLDFSAMVVLTQLFTVVFLLSWAQLSLRGASFLCYYLRCQLTTTRQRSLFSVTYFLAIANARGVRSCRPASINASGFLLCGRLTHLYF